MQLTEALTDPKYKLEIFFESYWLTVRELSYNFEASTDMV